MNLSTLLIDDDRAFAGMAAAVMRREGMQVTVAHSLYEARNALGAASPDFVLLDRRLPDGDGLQFLSELRSKIPSSTVVMVTAHGDIASAVEAVRLGASDYLTKPVELTDLLLKVKRSAEALQLRDRLEQAEAEISGRWRLIRPQSPTMAAAIEVLGRVAKSPRSPLLLLGETGTGKEVFARYFHSLAHREGAPFVHLNCAALPESTFESELFGYERGAFTDAKSTRRGLVEVANGGTLFLDEVGDLPLPLQAKLLTFLDSGRFRRLGGTVEQTSTARIVGATHRDLEGAGKKGGFRQDLWYRLSVFRVDLPPLRERREDVLPLAEGILASLEAEIGRRGASLSKEAQQRLMRYDFPGNVRELRNVIERALVLEPGPELKLSVLDAGSRYPVPESNSHEFRVTDGPIPIDELERRYARHVLASLGGRRMEAAQALGVSYPTFLKRIEGH